MEIPSRQEMFNRAWNGLKSQGWERSFHPGQGCLYRGPNATHCAWGWVDMANMEELTRANTGSVYTLYDLKIGLAAALSDDDIEWAAALQTQHDSGTTPEIMEKQMRHFAEVNGLTVPE